MCMCMCAQAWEWISRRIAASKLYDSVSLRIRTKRRIDGVHVYVYVYVYLLTNPNPNPNM